MVDGLITVSMRLLDLAKTLTPRALGMGTVHPASVIAEDESLLLGQPLHVAIPRGIALLGLCVLAVLIPTVLGHLIAHITPTAAVGIDGVNTWFIGFWSMLIMGVVVSFVPSVLRGIRPRLDAFRRGRLAAQGLPDFKISWSMIPRSYLLSLADHIGLPVPGTDAKAVRTAWVRTFKGNNADIKRLALHELRHEFPWAVRVS